MKEKRTQRRGIADPVVHDKSVYRWLWSGVGIFSVAILAIWLFNMSAFITEKKQTLGADELLIADSKADFEKTLEIVNNTDSIGERLQEIRDEDDAEEKKLNENKIQGSINTVISDIFEKVKSTSTTADTVSSTIATSSQSN